MRLTNTNALLIALMASSLAACGTDSVEGELAPEELEEQPFELLDDVRPGDVLADGDAALVVPPRGSGLVATVLHDDGSADILRVETLADGRVVRYFDSQEFHDVAVDEHDAPEGSARAASTECSQGAYSLLGFKWTSTLRWRANLGSRPGYLGIDATRTALRVGVRNIVASINPCGLADQVSARQEYLGTTSRHAGVSSAGACLANDGYNVVSFGTLPGGTLGVTCTYFDSSRRAVASDIKFNRSVSWYPGARPSGCSGRFSLRAVAVHEWGHAYGLGHVSESSYPRMTMSTSIAPCDNSHASLGLGDVRGLRAMY